jgi:hypothetical protein
MRNLSVATQSGFTIVCSPPRRTKEGRIMKVQEFFLAVALAVLASIRNGARIDGSLRNSLEERL